MLSVSVPRVGGVRLRNQVFLNIFSNTMGSWWEVIGTRNLPREGSGRFALRYSGSLAAQHVHHQVRQILSLPVLAIEDQGQAVVDTRVFRRDIEELVGHDC